MTEPFWIGMTINDVAAIAGHKRYQVEHWLRSNGFTVEKGRIVRAKSVFEREDEIARRIATAPPSAGCSRCGCRVCEHQGSAVPA